MMRKKVCMVGGTAVGKSSLVRRFVYGMFSESYMTTIGVKVDKKDVTTPSGQVELLLWDIHGDDEFARIRSLYLRGMAGYFLVADGTRRETLDHALSLKKRIDREIGLVPCLLLINKGDLADSFEIDAADLEEVAEQHSLLQVLRTSAKDGEGVEQAFELLVAAMLL
jgi:small GTP-binding protein